MGYPINETLHVVTTTETEFPVTPLEFNDNFEPALRTDYKIKELGIKVLETEQAAVRAGALPRLSAIFRYGAVSFADHFNNSYNEILPYSMVGLRLNIPVLDVFSRRARYRQAQLAAGTATESLQLTRAKFTIEYENARAQLLQAYTNVDNGRRNIKLAESVLGVTDLQFRKGITNLTEWLTAQYALREAQNNYLTSLYSYYQARMDVEKAAGTLKNFYNAL